MKDIKKFTFQYIENQYSTAKSMGYKFVTCEQYAKGVTIANKTIVNRVDIDYSVKKAERLRLIFDKLNIKATFFVRLHAPEYNPFSFENYRILKNLINSGHEIGYHSEVVDQSKIWNEDPTKCLEKDVEILNKMLGIKINGIASHGGLTGNNNLDFWNNKKASDFGLMYEAYENSPNFSLFKKSFYISDSEWVRWKCYNKGVLLQGDHRDLSEHIIDNHQLICLLIHPDTYFDNHIYE